MCLECQFLCFTHLGDEKLSYKKLRRIFVHNCANPNVLKEQRNYKIQQSQRKRMKVSLGTVAATVARTDAKRWLLSYVRDSKEGENSLRWDFFYRSSAQKLPRPSETSPSRVEAGEKKITFVASLKLWSPVPVDRPCILYPTLLF
jgi:hypothetical protein